MTNQKQVLTIIAGAFVAALFLVALSFLTSPNEASAENAVNYSEQTLTAQKLYTHLQEDAAYKIVQATKMAEAAASAKSAACNAQELLAQLKYNDTPATMTDERVRLHDAAVNARTCGSDF